MAHDEQEEIRGLVRCLDLTSLNDDDNAAVIEKLCARANEFGVAAVCVYPKFVKQAREQTRQGIMVASVANFPHGSEDIEQALSEVEMIKSSGGNEVDVVLPYKSFREGKRELCRAFLEKVKRASEPLKLKVIIESGELEHLELIRQAAQLCLDIGADYVKTSTGKTKVSATPEAAQCILEAIKVSGKQCGFKASGGIRTVQDALQYSRLVESTFGTKPNSENFRIGASSLLNDLERALTSKEIGTTATTDSGY